MRRQKHTGRCSYKLVPGGDDGKAAALQERTADDSPERWSTCRGWAGVSPACMHDGTAISRHSSLLRNHTQQHPHASLALLKYAQT